MPLRSVAADGLAPALLHLEERDDRRPEPPDEKQGGEDGRSRPRRLVAEHVEDRDLIGQAGEQVIEHQRRSLSAGWNCPLMASTSGPMRLPSDPLTITTSPAFSPPSSGAARPSDFSA